MSLEQVKSVIENFVQNDRNDLLIIKGDWGVGKTFFWQDTVEKLSRKTRIGHPKYSYVSLFGIDSFETLKNSIVANQINSSVIGKDFNESASALLSKLKNILKFSERSNYVRNFSGGLISEFAFHFIKDSLICFDDLERRSDKFDIKDVLGLASFLKEQRNCKIVFILNDEKLLDKETFGEHNEKVVDIEVNFAPLPVEVFDYIFDKSHPYFELIKFSCLILEIKNIRILQRIKRFIEDLLPHLKGLEEVVAEDVIRSIILFVWSYYDKGKDTISIDYLETYNSIDLYVKKSFKEEEITEDEEKKHKLLWEYRYGNADAVDIQLLNFVKKGFLNNSFFDALQLKNNQVIAQKGKDSYSEVWKLYKTSFELDENVFIEKLVSGFRSNAEYLSFTDLYDTASILRSLGQDELANALIDDYLFKMISYKQFLELKRLPHFEEYNDEYFLKKLNQIPRPPDENYNFGETIEKLASENRYYGEEVTFLASCDESEYYNFFKSENSSDIYYSAKFLLKLGNTTNSNTNENEIILDKTKKTLIKIASESRINELRISRWFDLEIEKKL